MPERQVLENIDSAASAAVRPRIGLSRWAHRWLSLVLGPLLLLWAVSGIVLNHRTALARFAVPRRWLSRSYQYDNWNLAAVRGGLALGDGSYLMYGNVGIWKTDANFQRFTPLMEGLAPGLDSRRTFKALSTPAGGLYAGTQSGLYRYDAGDGRWRRIRVPSRDRRIVDLAIYRDRVVALTRDEIFLLDDAPDAGTPFRIALPPPAADDGRTTLFRVLWMLHSGQLYGRVGVALVDAVGMLLIFFCGTGYIYYSFPGIIRRRVRRRVPAVRFSRVTRLFTRWHRRLGIGTVAVLIVVVASSMFLRPPLLLLIAGRRATPPPGSVLAGSSDVWIDRLRTLYWDDQESYWIVGADDGFYRVAEHFDAPPVRLDPHPPLSVMGINVFEPMGQGTYLVGSFSGLFVWNPRLEWVCDYFTGEAARAGPSMARPGEGPMIAGLIRRAGRHLIFDYSRGLLTADIPMPEMLRNQPFPLWNLALEVHTGRIFQDAIGSAYIFIVPVLAGLTLWILVAGVVVWFRRR